MHLLWFAQKLKVDEAFWQKPIAEVKIHVRVVLFILLTTEGYFSHASVKVGF